MLAHDNELDTATVGMLFVPGDRLRTANGRVEVLFPDGSVLDVDESAAVELQSPTVLRITRGRVLFTALGADSSVNGSRYQFTTPVASVQTEEAGQYRIWLSADASDAAGLQTGLEVLRGAATLATDWGEMPVRMGERSVARNNDRPSVPQALVSGRPDEFEQWTAERDQRSTRSRSAQYLPPDLRPYGADFDRGGAWEYEQPYGYVWYPASAPGWRPYYDGYWASVAPYGWTWIGFDAWSWPTHHYGRWGFARDRWFWMPDRRWAPAWVEWATAAGYVGWCPLGFDNRPVFGFSLTGGPTPWAGWVVLPQTLFGVRSAYVARYAVPPHRIPAQTAFITHAAAPMPLRRAVPLTLPAARGSRAGAAGSFGVMLEQNSHPTASTASGRRSDAARPGGEAVPRVDVTTARPGVVTPPAGLSSSYGYRSGRLLDERARGPRSSPDGPTRAATMPGAVPRWSAPSQGVPMWSAPSIGVPTWSAPSVGVPRWSAPSIPVAPSSAVPDPALSAAPAAVPVARRDQRWRGDQPRQAPQPPGAHRDGPPIRHGTPSQGTAPQSGAPTATPGSGEGKAGDAGSRRSR